MLSIMWWQSFFDTTYLELWAHLHPRELCEREADLLVERLDLRRGDTILDAPCGYGRIAIPLARRGMRVTSVDYSSDLLDHGQKCASSEELRVPITWRQEDLRTAELGSAFTAAINLFSSIGYGSEEDDLATLTNLHSALTPGGQLFIETMHRDAIVHFRAQGKTTGIRGPSGITLRERNSFDPVAGTIESTWTWTSPTIAGSRTSTIRIYSTTELVALVRRAGFVHVRCFVGLTGEALCEANAHERLGLLCVAAGGSPRAK
ncbi:MAG: methyltransferase domain-containing protein [Myxococcales bacterium]|nr:methyltransferase domain-containing protein [Myxococcales bacterium]